MVARVRLSARPRCPTDGEEDHLPEPRKRHRTEYSAAVKPVANCKPQPPLGRPPSRLLGPRPPQENPPTASVSRLPRAPSAPPPPWRLPAPELPPVEPIVPLYGPRSTLDVTKYSVSCNEFDWACRAYEIFEDSGFVIVEDVLDLVQCQEVVMECESLAEQIVCPSRRSGNRGPGRYSMGIASSTGSVLHLPSFARVLLDYGGQLLHSLLELIFDSGRKPGFHCIGGGGDFVVSRVLTHQYLHSDIQVASKHNVKMPPPQVSVNFCVQELTSHNGPTRIVPRTQLTRAPKKEPPEWKHSRLCPVPAGAALVRDIRVLHGGTPNDSCRNRYLPSIEFVSADFRFSNRHDRFPPRKCLPSDLYDELSPKMQLLCQELVAANHDLNVSYTRK